MVFIAAVLATLALAAATNLSENALSSEQGSGTLSCSEGQKACLFGCCDHPNGFCCPILSPFGVCCPQYQACSLFGCIPFLKSSKPSLMQKITGPNSYQGNIIDVQLLKKCPGGTHSCPADCSCCTDDDGGWTCCKKPPRLNFMTKPKDEGNGTLSCSPGQKACLFGCCDHPDGFCCPMIAPFGVCCPHNQACSIFGCIPFLKSSKPSLMQKITGPNSYQGNIIDVQLLKKCPGGTHSCPADCSCCTDDDGGWTCCNKPLRRNFLAKPKDPLERDVV